MNYRIYLFKREKKNRFYVQFNDETGRLRSLSTGVTLPLKYTNKQRDEAEHQAKIAAKKKVLKALGMDHPTTKKNIDKLSVYLDRYYYPHIRTNRAERTLETYQRSLDHFIRVCGDKPLQAYSRSHIHDYKIIRFDTDGIQKTTINIELRSIKAAFSWAYKNDFLDKFQFKGQEFLFDAPTSKREFKTYEINKLFEATEGTMIGLAIRLAYYTGMRQGELSNITWRMVHEKERFVHLPASITKSGKPRRVPLSNGAFNVIKVLENVLKTKRRNHPKWYKNTPFLECYILQKDRGFGQYQSRSLQDMFRKYMNKAGLPKELTFHCLRHSFATHVLERGADLYGVSKIMGHSSPAVTAAFYDHTTALNYRGISDLLC